MPFQIVRQDITKMKVDAIVNAANTSLLMGSGVCGAIFKAAGAKKLQAACDVLAPIETGEAVITPGFALDAKHVIHTVGPIYHEHTAARSEELLRSAYLESLKLATAHDLQSIAFPLISSGIYGYPKAEALAVARNTIEEYLRDHELDVFLAVFDREAFVVSEKLMGAVESYIDEHYAIAHEDVYNRVDEDRKSCRKHEAVCYDEAPMPLGSPMPSSIAHMLDNLDESFSETLLRLIDTKGKTDVDVYKRANIDRKLFSKIRTNTGYMPSKRTAISLAIALELTLEETESLLKRAGYSLSHSHKFDLIIEYFIINRMYNIFEINEVLFKYDQPLLGC